MKTPRISQLIERREEIVLGLMVVLVPLIMTGTLIRL